MESGKLVAGVEKVDVALYSSVELPFMGNIREETSERSKRDTSRPDLCEALWSPDLTH